METLEIVVCVDANGDYRTGRDADEAREKYEEDIGALAECDGFRIYNLTLTVPLPRPVEVSGTVARTDDSATLTVK
jgi:hypothetical protein